MNLLTIALISAAILLIAYRFYGSLLARLLKLDDSRPTPATQLRDDVDYVPTEPKFLLGQHFSAIAAAGPIVGPILAGLMFGWLPALIWILIGSIFIGGVHDLAALVASVRHKARSIAEVVQRYMTRRSYLLFLAFIWIALIYIIVAFTDIVAGSFVLPRKLEDGTSIPGGATASSSLIYLALPLVMGLLLRFTKLTVGYATLIFLPLVGVAIWAGPKIPLDFTALLGMSEANAIRLWDVLLLGYCLLAAVVPMWLLLQPRGHLGGCFLYVALGGAVIGILAGAMRSWMGDPSAVGTVEYPWFTSWTTPKGESLAPMLFITIACGACSGFHCLIASGTTSKQLRRETDAKLIGYGAMLLEGMVAVVALGCVMILAAGSPATKGSPDFIFANGLSRFFHAVGIPPALGLSFGLLAFTTFVYDTLDVCTRLGRYIVQELTGWTGTAGKWFATLLTVGAPLIFVMQSSTDKAGNPIPAWRVFWSLFGASNQLLAALALIGITVWLWSTRRAKWVWIVTGLPALWMYAMSSWALALFIRNGFWTPEGVWQWPTEPVPWAAALLMGLALLLLVEAIKVFFGHAPRVDPPAAEPAIGTAE